MSDWKHRAAMAEVVGLSVQSEPMVRVVLNALTDLTPKFGSRIYLRELARALVTVEGVELRLLTNSKYTSLLPPALQACAVEVGVPAEKSYWQVLFARRIAATVRREEASVYHLPNTLPLLVKPGPTVVTIHDTAELRLRKHSRIRTLYRWAINYLAAHVADHIITVSEYSKRDIAELLRVSSDKITVVYNAVGDEFQPADRDACRRYVAGRYGFRGDYVLAPGGLSRNKNVEKMLEAFEAVVRPGRELNLVITGDAGSSRLRDVNRCIEQLRIRERVWLTGYVATSELVQLYNGCSLVVYASLYEGFGFPVLESMACGAPLVTSSTSSIPEVAGDAAVLVDPNDSRAIADAMIRVLSDEQLRQRLVARGLERARRFSWHKVALDTLAVYRKVAQSLESAAACK